MCWLLVYIFLGLISGLFSGLLGIGGGFITVPALYYIFLLKQSPPLHVMQTAISTSLVCIVVTSIVSILCHQKNKSFYTPALQYLVPGLILGCIFGALLALLLPSSMVRTAFGLMAIPIGAYFVFPKLPIPVLANKPNPLLFMFGLIIGHLSSFLGIGGGIYTIPLLYAYGVTGPKVSGTSSLATFTTSLTGSLAYFIIAKSSTTMQVSIDLMSMIGICLGSVYTTYLGVKLSHKLHGLLIKRIFGSALVATGIAMLLT